MLTQDEAMELVGQLERSRNYPKEVTGVMQLAQDLQTAANTIGVPGDAIVRRCAALSEWCPTLAEFMVVARGIRGYDRSAEENQQNRICKYERCDGSGWREVCHLHTRQNLTSNWKTEVITRQQFEDLEHKVDGKMQKVYSGRYRCKCHPPSEERKTTHGRYA